MRSQNDLYETCLPYFLTTEMVYIQQLPVP